MLAVGDSLSGLEADDRCEAGPDCRAPTTNSTASGVARTGGSEKQLQWQMALTVFLVATFVFALSPVVTNYDSFATLPTAVSIVNRHTLSLNAYQHVKVLATELHRGSHQGPSPDELPMGSGIVRRSRRGRHRSGPRLRRALSRFHRHRAIAHRPSGPAVDAPRSSPDWPAPAWPFSPTGACGARHRTRRRWAMLCGLAFAFATSAWSTASRALWEHGPSILFIAVALLALDRLFPRNTEAQHASGTSSAWPPLLAGLTLAAAVTMRPTNAVALALGTILVLWKTSTRCGTAYVVGVLAVLVPWTLVTLHYLRDAAAALPPGEQARPLLDVLRIRGGTVRSSPSRGLFVFSPIVLVTITGVVIAWRRKSTTPLEVLCVMAVPLLRHGDRSVSHLVGGDQLRAPLHDGDACRSFSFSPCRS